MRSTLQPQRTPPCCPYCEGPASFLLTSDTLYRRDYGPVWICQPCQAWVGCHPGTTRPLGRLADAELRRAKNAAHAAFDFLWQDGYCTRPEAYAWLAAQLGIPIEECHIGHFDIPTCHRVVVLCDDLDC